MYIVLTSLYRWGNVVAWAAALLSIPFWLYLIIYGAPKVQLILQQRQEAIARESDAFCERYGIPPGTSRHRQCVDDLMNIWAKQEQRIAQEVDDSL